MNYDDIIFGFDASSKRGRLDDGVWSATIGHIVEQLSKTFGQDIRLVGGQNINFDDGFSVDFRSEGLGPSLWKFRLRGVIGADVIDNSILVRAWVFFYINDARVSVEGQGHVLLMKYVKIE